MCWLTYCVARRGPHCGTPSANGQGLVPWQVPDAVSEITLLLLRLDGLIQHVPLVPQVNWMLPCGGFLIKYSMPGLLADLVLVFL